MNIHEILSVKLFAIILGYPQGIIPYNNPVYVGRGIALGLADTQRCLDTFVCPKREKKKVFFFFLVVMRINNTNSLRKFLQISFILNIMENNHSIMNIKDM